MGKTLVVAARSNATTLQSGNGVAIGGSVFQNFGAESNVQVPLLTAGTFSRLAWKVTADAEDRFLRFRINASDGDQVVDAGDTTAGVFEDTTNTDTPFINDLLSLVPTDGAGDAADFWTRLLFEATSGHKTLFIASDATTVDGFGQGYLAIVGRLQRYGPNGRLLFRSPCTFRNLSVKVTSNSRSDTTTIKLRVNGVDTSLGFGIGAGQTGVFQDTSNTADVEDGDEVGLSLEFAGEGGNIVLQTAIITAEWATLDQDDIFSQLGEGGGSDWSRAASATTHYLIPYGRQNNTLVTTESDAQLRTGYIVPRVSHMRVYVNSNTYAAAATFRFRKNAGNGNQVISITASTTGYFEDTTNEDTLDEDDDFCYSIVGGTSGDISLYTTGLTLGQEYTYINPDADDTDGAWTNEVHGSELFSHIDEAGSAISDADYIKSGGEAADTCKIRLENPGGTPQEPFQVQYRYGKNGTDTDSVDLRVRLLQGSTAIAEWYHQDVSEVPLTATQTLTTAEFSSISDFNDLFLEFTHDALLLDKISSTALASLTGAWSFRKLRAAYAGAPIEVRRSSDNAEQDIPFDGIYLDTEELIDFVTVGGTQPTANGFVTTMYDQSGNARDLTQATTTRQPLIVESGVMNELVNGRTTQRHIDDDNVQSAVDFGTFMSQTQWTLFAGARPTTAGDNDTNAVTGGKNLMADANANFAMSFGSTKFMAGHDDAGGGGVKQSIVNASYPNTYIAAHRFNAGGVGVTAILNGTEGSSTSEPDGPVGLTGGLRIGDGGGPGFVGYTWEGLAFDEDIPDADVNTIGNDMAMYAGVDWADI